MTTVKMATGIEAEMARFEEEVLGNEHRSRRPGPGLPDMPPPPFMQRPFDMMPGPGDMMMGPGPMHGLGPMMMGPGGMAPDRMMTKPKVYSAPPQITKAPQVIKRKAGDVEIGVSASKVFATEAPSSSSAPDSVCEGLCVCFAFLIISLLIFRRLEPPSLIPIWYRSHQKFLLHRPPLTHHPHLAKLLPHQVMTQV